MDSKIYSSILKTICYADVFGYPLREDEVYKWINDSRIVGYSDIKRANGVIQHKDNFMFLSGRWDIIAKRKERQNISKKKLLLAERISAKLTYIPMIKLIGVSGSISMENATVDDDIDLFIVAKEGTVWLTRLFATIIVEFFSKRRRPDDSDVADKICLNMFIDEKHLAIPGEKQNLYTAHEVCQLKVLFDKDNTHAKFLYVNRWAKKYLPNALLARGTWHVGNPSKLSAIRYVLYACEWLAKHLQLWYMRRRRTTETISDSYLAFHPKDYTKEILAAFEERFTFYGSHV